MYQYHLTRSGDQTSLYFTWYWNFPRKKRYYGMTIGKTCTGWTRPGWEDSGLIFSIFNWQFYVLRICGVVLTWAERGRGRGDTNIVLLTPHTVTFTPPAGAESSLLVLALRTVLHSVTHLEWNVVCRLEIFQIKKLLHTNYSFSGENHNRVSGIKSPVEKKPAEPLLKLENKALHCVWEEQPTWGQPWFMKRC